MIRVMLVDDQEMVRAGFRLLLEVEDDITIVAEASDGLEAVDTVRVARPDVVLMDVQMPKMNGLEATGAILSSNDSTAPPKIVILTTFGEDDYIFEALRLGASGFLLKNAEAEDLVDAIRVVAAGDALLDPTVTRRVIGSFAGAGSGGRKGPSVGNPGGLATLTVREREVLLHLGRGMTNSEIAAELILGESTIKTYVSNVLSKLQLRDRIQAVIFSYENNLVDGG